MRDLGATAFRPHSQALELEDRSHTNTNLLIQVNELAMYEGFGELLESHLLDLRDL